MLLDRVVLDCPYLAPPGREEAAGAAPTGLAGWLLAGWLVGAGLLMGCVVMVCRAKSVDERMNE